MNKSEKEASKAAKVLAKMGGDANLKKHGRKQYVLMAKKRWNKNK